MQCKQVEQRGQAVLVKLHEAHQHQRACEHVSDIESEAVHLQAPRYEQQERCQQSEHQRCAEKFGYAENPHFGDDGLEQREQEPADRELGDIGKHAERKPLPLRRLALPGPRA